jgi:hypothetical protein
MSDIIERLAELSDLMMNDRPYNDSDFTDIDEAIDEIKRLRKERDEARREICARTAYPDRTPQMEAKMRGWNCYEAQEQAMKRLSELDEELGLI